MTTETKPIAFTWPELSKGFVDFHENTILQYGMPKIGKSTLASQFPSPLFFATEDGHKHLKVHKFDIRAWTDFLFRVGELEKNISTCPFRTIIIDTVDNLSDMCIAFVVNKLGVQDLGDAGYGKGFAAYTREFNKAVRRLTSLGLGVVYISHAEEKEVDADSVVNPYAAINADAKGKTTMIVPTVEKRARKFILGQADMILYLEILKDLTRVIHAHPCRRFEAGDRSGRLPATLPLSYDAIVTAYYGGGEKVQEAVDDLLERIKVGVGHLSSKRIDGFDVKKRVDNWYKAHVGTSPTVDKLQSALQDLRVKARTIKPEDTQGEPKEEEQS